MLFYIASRHQRVTEGDQAAYQNSKPTCHTVGENPFTNESFRMASSERTKVYLPSRLGEKESYCIRKT